jgi:hypothetical protein
MIAACRATFAAIAVVACAAPASAQGAGPRRWNDSATVELVSRAVQRRTAQLADTGLTDYKAVAHGYLTFFAQLGEGFPVPPQIVRADELAVEVYWRAPNQSKQRVVGRRDTLLLPTDISYHRDHLAVVQNNFPAIIRLGDGDEVRDVPHPLSAVGRDAYQFAVTDSLSIRVAGRVWDVVAVDVRPRDDQLPRVVGTLYLDRETGSVVRMNLTFTRAALIDPALEDISVSLDNGLVEGRFWLPRRQEIEIRRRGEWLDFPARGIIRGEWDLCCVEPNRGVPPELFAGPEITIVPPQELARYPFVGSLRDSLQARVLNAGPERAAADLQRRALGLVRAEAITRGARAAASAARISDFVRVNRVEGLALGAGFTFRLPRSFALRAEGRYGIDDALLKHRVALNLPPLAGVRVSLSGFDEYRDARDAPELSRLGNSFAAAEFGADFTDEFRASGASVSLSAGERWRWRADLERLRERGLAVNATPFTGSFRPAFGASNFNGTRAALRVSTPELPIPMEFRLRVSMAAALRWPASDSSPRPRPLDRLERLATSLELRRAASRGEWLLLVRGVTGGLDGPAQGEAIFGGPSSAPGYASGILRGRYGLTTRLERQFEATAFVLGLGRFGATRVPVILAPYVNGAWVHDDRARDEFSRNRSVGLGLITAHGLLRLDVARGVDRLGGWSVYADFGRAFWPIL